MQKRLNRGKSALYRFDSLRELGEFIKNTPRKWTSNSSRDHAPREGWDLCAGYDGAVRMAVEGWNEGAERTQEALNVFLPTVVEPETVTDFYGFRPHVARYCAGAPDCMIRKAYSGESGAGRVVTIAVSLSAYSYARAECLANFGVAVAQYVAQLETQGTRVELLGSQTTLMDGVRMNVTFTVKNADQPLDLSVIAFAIGHPAMLRRLILAVDERCDLPTNWGYGSPMDLKRSDIINAPDDLLILNGFKDADDVARTPQEGLAYVERRVNELIKEQLK